MAWQTPKTNWASADVPAPADFNRIEGNIQYLFAQAAKFDTRFPLGGSVGGSSSITLGAGNTSTRQCIFRNIPAGKSLKLKRASCCFTMSAMRLQVYWDGGLDPLWTSASAAVDVALDVTIATGPAFDVLRIVVKNSSATTYSIYPEDGWLLEFAIE